MPENWQMPNSQVSIIQFIRMLYKIISRLLDKSLNFFFERWTNTQSILLS